MGEDIISVGAILVPLVTVEDESISDLFICKGIAESLQDQINCVSLLDGKAHNKTVVKVFDHREISPTLLCRDEADIGGPLLIWTSGREIAL